MNVSMCPLCIGMKQINNELRRTQNELMPQEFVSVRFSSFCSLLFSILFFLVLL